MPDSACRLCGADVRFVTTQRLLGKFDVRYFVCSRCDLLQTEAPYWLDEAYEHAISQLDTGAIARNRQDAQVTAVIARVLGVRGACLDTGAGHGVFVRMMRDFGYDFRWSDRYAENLYARGFEDTPDHHHSLVTAFEVLEHFADVRTDLAQMFASEPDHVFVGTLLHEGHRDGWWYYLLDSGQHIAFYSSRTLAWIAEHFGYTVIHGPAYALFSRRTPSSMQRAVLRRLLAHPYVATLVPRPIVQRASLIETDHAALRERLR
jgi:hypothetical protein